MFPRRQRLSRAQFPAALSRGRRLSSANFSIVIPSSAITQGYAVVVSKKVARLSVTRHRLKRRVLAALRAFPHLSSALIVFPKASVLDLPMVDLRAELADILSKVGQ